MKLLHSSLLTGTVLGIAGIFTFATGCELVAGIDRTQIDQGNGGAPGSSSSSTSSSSSSSSGEAGAGGGGMGGMAGMAGMGGMGGMGGGGTGGGGMGGMGGGPECMTANDCPAPANECITVACVMGACVETNVTANTPTTNGQTAGDCKKSVCDGNGAITLQNDDTDTTTDNKACTQDKCANGMPSYPPENSGTMCMEGGGKVCNATGTCVECVVPADCASMVCQNNVCQTAQCGDNTQNGMETDVDCGGTCGGCMDGKKCNLGTDCISQVCMGMTCAVPTCTDTKKNGNETDVDCGGTCPNDCADGKGCAGNGDCQSGFCNPMTMMCATPACNDGFKNGSETDTDCGGPCPNDCMNGQSCIGNGDCTSSFCNPMTMTCAAPTCMDMSQNGNETDVDCGGTCPNDCMNGQGCSVNGDCVSTYCNALMTCAAPLCTDMVKNGTETDVDCGGTCPNDCMDGQGCSVNGDCVNGYCNAMTMMCATPTCMDNAKNGTETDVDCGGTCPNDCMNGQGCSVNDDCVSGMCYAGACVASVNGCDIATAMDLTGGAPTGVTFPNGNLTYLPKCIKVTVGTVVTFSATGASTFAGHPLQGGILNAMNMEVPASSGPFVPATNTAITSKPFTMMTPGTYPYYCQPHGPLGMNGAVFVVP